MAEKDYARAQRLNEVFKHLFVHYGIISQTAMADYMGISRTGLSAAFNGNKRNLTNNLFKKICASFPGDFNLDYLLTGEGTLLAAPPPSIPRPEGTQVSDLVEVDAKQEAQYTRTLFDLAMQVIKDNEALHRQLQSSIAELRSLIDRYGPPPGAESPKPAESTDDSDPLKKYMEIIESRKAEMVAEQMEYLKKK
jgi:transcriptional regulator with XRE-family HTH domain